MWPYGGLIENMAQELPCIVEGDGHIVIELFGYMDDDSGGADLIGDVEIIHDALDLLGLAEAMCWVDGVGSVDEDAEMVLGDVVAQLLQGCRLHPRASKCLRRLNKDLISRTMGNRSLQEIGNSNMISKHNMNGPLSISFFKSKI